MNPLKIIAVIKIEKKLLELKNGIFNTKNCKKEAGIKDIIPNPHANRYFKMRFSFGRKAKIVKIAISGRKQSANKNKIFI